MPNSLNNYQTWMSWIFTNTNSKFKQANAVIEGNFMKKEPYSTFREDAKNGKVMSSYPILAIDKFST